MGIDRNYLAYQSGFVLSLSLYFFVCTFCFIQCTCPGSLILKAKWQISLPAWDLKFPLGEPQLAEDKEDCLPDHDPTPPGGGKDPGGVSNSLQTHNQTSGCLAALQMGYIHHHHHQCQHHHCLRASCVPHPVSKVYLNPNVDTLDPSL